MDVRIDENSREGAAEFLKRGHDAAAAGRPFDALVAVEHALLSLACEPDATGLEDAQWLAEDIAAAFGGATHDHALAAADLAAHMLDHLSGEGPGETAAGTAETGFPARDPDLDKPRVTASPDPISAATRSEGGRPDVDDALAPGASDRDPRHATASAQTRLGEPLTDVSVLDRSRNWPPSNSSRPGEDEGAPPYRLSGS